jgi:FKBP-type peptidyl-prolyl cis-trans isomerase FkpA
MIKKVIHFVVLSFCLASMTACAQSSGTGTSAPPKIETEEQKTLYALGLLLGRNIKPFALNPDELAIVKAGLSVAVTDTKPQVELETYGPKVEELAQKRAAAGADEVK